MKNQGSFCMQQNNLGPQHNEQSYKLYWSFLDNFYFRDINEEELELLDRFSSQIYSSLPANTKSSPPKKVNEPRVRLLNGEKTDPPRKPRRQKIPDGSVPQIEAYVKSLVRLDKLRRSPVTKEEQQVVELDYENLLKQITLSLSTSPLICNAEARRLSNSTRIGSEGQKSLVLFESLKDDSTFQKLFEEKYSFNPWRRPCQNNPRTLGLESQVLGTLLQKKWIKDFRKDRQSNEISDQIGFLLENLEQVNQENRISFSSFHNKMIKAGKSETNTKLSQFLPEKGGQSYSERPKTSQNGFHLSKFEFQAEHSSLQTGSGSPKRVTSFSKKRTSDYEAHYMFMSYYIFQLEMKQLAESISIVTNVRAEDHSQNESSSKRERTYEFEVFLEENISDESTWVSESCISYLNSLRECSLFDIYPISAKCSSPYVSHNIGGFETIGNVKDGQKLPREKSTMEWLKNRFSMQSLTSGEVKDSLKKELREKYKYCHHCKSLLPNSFVVRCNYRSGLMGPSILTPAQENYKTFFSKRGTKNTQLVSQTRICGYRRTPIGEQICLRYYCVFCLKLTYEANIKEIRSSNDWMCPACSGSCCCTRCNRNELLVKLAFIFARDGGDLRLIREESPIASILDKLPFLTTIEAVHKGALSKGPSPLGRLKYNERIEKHAQLQDAEVREEEEKKLLLIKARSRLEQERNRILNLRDKEQAKTDSLKEKCRTLKELKKVKSVSFDNLLMRKVSLIFGP